MAYVPDFVVALVGSLLNNLTQSFKDNLTHSVKENFELINGLKGNVKNLWNELGQLKALSQQFTEREDNDHPAGLANEIRDVMNHAEDAIDAYFLETQRQKLRNSVDQARNAIDYTVVLRDIAKEIKDMTLKVSNLRQTKIQHGLKIVEIDKTAAAGESKKDIKVIKRKVRNLRQTKTKSSGESSKHDETVTADDIKKSDETITPDESEKKKRTFSFDDDVVGFKDEEKKVTELLTQGPKNLEVISIFGMLGLGKTTLARMVFNHPTVEYQFFMRAFVQVSQDYRRHGVFLKILEWLTDVIDEELYKASDEELAEIIRGYLENRQYLIVLDDVWDIKHWKEIKTAFPDNKKGSRILITTRHEPVALHAYPAKDPYNLRFLYREESMELLRKKVFGKNSCPSEFEEYETKILDRCNGLPLAIVVVAGILLNNRNKAYWWRDVSDGVPNYTPEFREEIHKVIKLSYNHLPYRLKPCFLYLGVFREDFEIPARTLLQLWVSEGFIEDKGYRSLEDVAEAYLEELAGRSLVMVGKRRPNGQIKTCRIHDTLRDFCKEKAEKEKLFREIKRFEQAPDSFGTTSTDNDRRRCINSYVEQYIRSIPAGEHVRSFLSFAKEETTLQPGDTSAITKAFKLLRVLDIRPIKLTRFPPDLYNLLLLKYIAISCNFKFLPEKMSYLSNLQTLIVKTSNRTLEIKWDIFHMSQLRHLDTNSSTSLAEGKEESSLANINLQTLSTISPESCRAEVFVRTPNLKKLGIKGNLAPYFGANGECSLFGNFQKLEFLENLKLLNDSNDKLQALPDHESFPSNLTRLLLSDTLLGWENMSTLGKLKKLEVLKLEDNAFWGESWETEDGGFKRLKVFLIGKTNLVTWKASPSNFPTLSHLYLKHCTVLSSIPHDFVHIPSLQIIDLFCTSPMVVSSARKLSLAKLHAQEKDNKTTGFKLSVYPPDQ